MVMPMYLWGIKLEKAYKLIVMAMQIFRVARAQDV